MIHCSSFLFFFNDTATTEIYTLSLHDALPICIFVDSRVQNLRKRAWRCGQNRNGRQQGSACFARGILTGRSRSEEHTSELQSQSNLVCRLLLEKKKK